MPETLSQFLTTAARDLAAASESPRLDAEVLCAQALGRSRAWLIAHGDEPLEPAARAVCVALLARRAAGAPIAHLTGRREFWSLDLEVSPATLIPRPETETLVEAALERLRPLARPRVLDLGTGSGALAVALGHERPDAVITAVERDPAALAVAQRNALRHGVTLEALAGEWFGPVAGRRFELIVSNPPYLAADDPHLAVGDVRAEPRTALVAGPEGLDDLAHLAAHAPAHLAPGGWLLLEHGATQGPAVRALLEAAGFTAVTTLPDAAGRPRVGAGRMAAPRGATPGLSTA
jgi:release factor glutamine methyltransferase